MGKWTSSHYDAVLNAKIKSLVSGAITRSRLENSDQPAIPTITYETFVEELDAGDSFTTSVVDILVKELAERRTRNSITDRRLIADRTAKNLRTLATSARVYRDRTRPFARRQLLASPPGELGMHDDDEEFDLLANEGVRVNTDLYEAFGGHSAWTNAMFRRESSSEERSSPPPQPPSPPTINSSSSLARILVSPPSSASPPPLSRSASLRRPPRSRTVDFNDFASRRRSIYRDAIVEENVVSESTRAAPPPPGQRRFFHFPRHHHRDGTSWTSPWLEDANERVFPSAEPTPSSGAWFYPLPLTPSLSRDSTDTETAEERVIVGAPRLRRGGVRAPESMLSRHASPAPEHAPSPIVETAAEASMAYPTPGPAEPENS